MKITVFYSWQSDKPRAIGMNFVQEALQAALQNIETDNSLNIEVSLDRDTQGVPGVPIIGETILSKIDKCGIFLADVSITTEATASKPSPNPNVLIELGYAVARVGWERMICVMNTAFGEPKCLPFDLQHRRWPICYNLKENASLSRIAKEKSKLADTLQYAIYTMIQNNIFTTMINPKDARVARKLYRALSDFIGNMASYLVNNDYEDAMRIILRDFPDNPGTAYPDLSIVDPIIEILSHNSLKNSSNVTINGVAISWAEVFINSLVYARKQCDSILDKFADRDDRLIALVDEMHNRSDLLADTIHMSITIPQLTELYDNGIPNVHKEQFQYFFVAILKSCRIIREFGVEIN